MDFFYSEAPGPMKSVCSALELLTVSLGQWLMAGLIPLVNSGDDKWIPSDLNEVSFRLPQDETKRKATFRCALPCHAHYRALLRPALTPPTRTSQGHLARFFLLLASLVGANLVAFVMISRRFDSSA